VAVASDVVAVVAGVAGFAAVVAAVVAVTGAGMKVILTLKMQN
jgi:hypothetical protein